MPFDVLLVSAQGASVASVTRLAAAGQAGTGIKVDQTKDELLITDAEPDQMKPVMQFMVEVRIAAKIKTLHPFKVIAEQASPAPP